MKRTTLIFSLAITATYAFRSQTPVFHRPTTKNTQSSSSSSSSVLRMGGASGFATSLEGKKEKVSKVKSLLENSEMIFSVPAGSLTVPETDMLRRSLPEGTTMSVVKNKLMAKALDGTPYEAASELLKGPNMWFFIEEDIGASVKAYKKFLKDASKQESHPLGQGVMDGVVYDGEGVEAISKLPSKLELITKVACGIKAVPTKLATVVKAPNEKLARAIKMATVDKLSEEGE